MALSKHEYEQYKSGIDKLVYKYLTRDRTTAVSIITHAVDSGADKRKVAEKLSAYADKALAEKLAEKSFQLLDKLGIKAKSRKRVYKDDDEKQNVPPVVKESKKARTEDTEMDSDKPAAPTNDTPHFKQIQEVMAKAQAAIDERKKVMAELYNTKPATNGADPPKPPSNNIAVAAAAGARIAELQARIRATMGAVPGLGSAPLPRPGLVMPQPSSIATQPKPAERAPPIILDSEGRTLDLTGKEVHITSRVPTLKANIRAKKREEFKQQLTEKPITDETPENEFYDPRVHLKSSLRPRKMTFKFHDKGKFVQQAQRERAKSRLEKLQREILTAARRTGISSVQHLTEAQDTEVEVSQEIPEIEWWDEVILQTKSYPSPDEEVRSRPDYITNLVEHPLEIKCPCDTDKSNDLQVFLTAKERKKLRRMNRRETWKEKQDKIRLGLEPPPEPKVKMANLMRVLGTEAVIDPTKMEKYARDQMAKRLKAHEKANADRKLTPQQRKEKRIGKIKEDTSTGVHVSVYRVTDMSNGSHKFKVETNAKQLFMTGTVVLYKDVNVVVVEGGPKQQKKYRQLMMNRIKWAEEARNPSAAIEHKCQLVWEGTVLDRNFGEMQFKSCPSETFARDHFKKHGVEQYWDMAASKKIAEECDL